MWLTSQRAPPRALEDGAVDGDGGGRRAPRKVERTHDAANAPRTRAPTRTGAQRRKQAEKGAAEMGGRGRGVSREYAWGRRAAARLEGQYSRGGHECRCNAGIACIQTLLRAFHPWSKLPVSKQAQHCARVAVSRRSGVATSSPRGAPRETRC
eukprot:5730727-Pleurochrysis_carterae.AAC.2